jgi:hypothetical protein
VACATAVRAEEPPKPPEPAKPAAPAKPKGLAIGERLEGLRLTDLSGGVLTSETLVIGKGAAEAAVRAAAKRHGAADGVDLATRVDALPGLREEGAEAVDPRLRRLFVADAGMPFGLQATEDTAQACTTLKDVVAWIEAARGAPIAFMTWSPKCGTCRSLHSRITEVAATTGLRLYAVASNFADSREKIEEYATEVDLRLRVFPDPDQAFTDALGGTRTPQFFVFDPSLTLRYKGGLDSDPAGVKEPQEVVHWLRDAVEALKAGKPVPLAETEPAG